MRRISSTRVGRTMLLALVAPLAIFVAVGPAVAQTAEELKAVLQIESGSQDSMAMEYFVEPDRIRLDVPQEMSLIWTSGANPSIVMAMHAQQQYLELGGQQLQMMMQMMQQMATSNPNAAAAPDPVDPSQLSFQTTSNQQQIGDWTAVEVLMTGPDGEEGSLWFADDAPTGLFELMSRVGEAAGALQMPMAGGGMGAAQQFLIYQDIAQAQGLPEGRVVRIESNDADGGATITLSSVEAGPLPAGTFDTPDGYTQMQIPFAPPGGDD